MTAPDNRSSISAKRRRAFRLVAVFASLVAVTIALEVGIRLTRPYHTPLTRKERSVQYTPAIMARHVMKPDQNILDGNARFEVNSRGYRGKDFAFEKTPGTTRIIFLGGSMVFTMHVSDGGDWPTLAGEKLRESGFPNVEVINAGVPGHASFDSLGRFYSELWRYNPDYVVVCHAWNDIKYFRSVTEEASLLRSMRPYDPTRDPRVAYRNAVDRVLCESSQLYVRVRRSYYDRILDTDEEGAIPEGALQSDYDSLALEQYRMQMALLVDAARYAGAKPVFVTQPTLAHAESSESDRKKIKYQHVMLTHEALIRAFEDCRDAVYEVAEEKEVPVIDLYPEISGKSGLFRDTVHTSLRGNIEVAELVAQALAEILSPESAKGSTEK